MIPCSALCLNPDFSNFLFKQFVYGRYRMGLKVVFQLSIIFQKYAAFFIISSYDVLFSSEKLSANGICLFSASIRLWLR